MIQGWILMWDIAILVVVGWWQLRGDSCWRCGHKTGDCQHTAWDEPENEA